jgi:ketosteroid isomerase-like protein
VEPTEIARRWLNAFNTKDIEALLDLYHPEAIHYSPKLKMRLPQSMGLIQGHQAMRKWWQEAFDRMPDLHYREVAITCQNNRVFIQYVREVSGDEPMDVAEYLELENQWIVRSRVYHG